MPTLSLGFDLKGKSNIKYILKLLDNPLVLIESGILAQLVTPICKRKWSLARDLKFGGCFGGAGFGTSWAQIVTTVRLEIRTRKIFFISICLRDKSIFIPVNKRLKKPTKNAERAPHNWCEILL
jgi:hypothetical protein